MGGGIPIVGGDLPIKTEVLPIEGGHPYITSIVVSQSDKCKRCDYGHVDLFFSDVYCAPAGVQRVKPWLVTMESHGGRKLTKRRRGFLPIGGRSLRIGGRLPVEGGLQVGGGSVPIEGGRVPNRGGGFPDRGESPPISRQPLSTNRVSASGGTMGLYIFIFTTIYCAPAGVQRVDLWLATIESRAGRKHLTPRARHRESNTIERKPLATIYNLILCKHRQSQSGEIVLENVLSKWCTQYSDHNMPRISLEALNT